MDENELLLQERYEVLGTLHRGPAADVLLAFDRRLGRRVALHLSALPAALAPEDQAARCVCPATTEREARAVARLRHPNLETVYDVSVHDATLLVASEVEVGRTLAQLLERDGPLPLADALNLVEQAARGLAFAHANGVLHGSLDPTTLRLTASGSIKVCGLGRRGVRGARPLAPERSLGRGSTESTDVWGLGAVLYEMLSGRPPFAGEPLDLGSLACLESPRSIRQLRRDVPPRLDTVLQTCLERDPALRYPSVHAFLQALRAARPASCAPVPATTKLDGRPRRPLLAWLLLAVAVTLAACVLSLARAIRRARAAPPDGSGPRSAREAHGLHPPRRWRSPGPSATGG